ncbi:acyl-CoA carboxylase subunit epsilon [Streptomyces sp. NPDC048639]|uniref:acyl-CoA carboxylase subunit epsilon n=1 Tax=Streptomyces sp. NPDC048639 TaxID=3365581 RepID=UPI003722B18C
MSITDIGALIRVEKGHAGPEELAVITAVLLARAGAHTGAGRCPDGRSAAGWRRLERESGYNAPHSWCS